MKLITPHGGKLVNKISKKEEDLKGLPRLNVSDEIIADIELIANGGYSPLEGFMGYEDYENVLERKRLANDLPWTMPIILSVNEGGLKEGEGVVLIDNSNKEVALLNIEEKYRFNKERMALLVYGTKSEEHPGVRDVYKMGDYLLGGKINLIRKLKREFTEYTLTPLETREIFEKKGWKTVTGFQTRNPIHRAHEYIQKCSLEITDGLFIHPIVGKKKEGDFSSKAIMATYEAAISHYYPKDRVLLACLITSMRYAGPREAIFHAIVRKNFGCSHFVVGRDHAGVGNFYKKYTAWKIFEEFEEKELEIQPLFFMDAFYCKVCMAMATEKTCCHPDNFKIKPSGTLIREMIKKKTPVPKEMMRTEVFEVLVNN